MLSKAAEAALLKTLEEPPPHVVFVLATTDPQKVSDTIRSRTQHLQFHLLPASDLEAHVRWVADDAGLELTDAALRAVLRQGGGSARDTLSALELAAATGGTVDEATPLDEFVESLIDGDTARALTAIARSVQQGRDPRGLTEDIVRHLRDCFLSLMAPDVVQISADRLELLTEQSRRLGAAAIVRAMEVLGTMLVEMRHAPDPRLLVEVAFVRLTRPQLDASPESLAARVEQLERTLREGGGQVGVSPATTTRPSSPVTRNSSPATSASTSSPPDHAASVPGDSSPGGRARLGARAGRDATGGLPRPVEPDTSPVTQTPTDVPAPASAGDALQRLADVWTAQVLPALKPIVRALYSSLSPIGVRDGAFVLSASNEATVQRAEKDRSAVEAVSSKLAGGPVRLALVVANAKSDAPATPSADHEESAVIDHSELADVPPESVVSSVDLLTQAFPGSVLAESDD